MCVYPAVEIVRTRSYAKGVKRLRKLGATVRDILAMEDSIASDAARAPVIPGSGGLRKVRFGYGGVGERGGGRTIYYVLTADERVYLLITYPKVDKEDLTKDELRLFRNLVKDLIRG